MSILIIKRANETLNMLRNYKVYLDEKEIGVIANGQTKAFDISPGVHSVRLKIDWVGSQKLMFEIADGEEKTFSVKGFVNSKVHIILFLLSLIVLGITLFFNDSIYTSVWLPYCFGVPLLLIIIYYMTIGRNKYLTLR